MAGHARMLSLSSSASVTSALLRDYSNLWGLDSLELKTYDEWKKEGYQVKQGEKAITIWGNKAIWYKGQLKDENGNLIPDTGEPIKYCQMKNVFDITQTFHVENCK